VAAGRRILRGLDTEIQKQLQDKIREFVDTSVSALQVKIADRIASEETGKALGQRRRKGLERLLERTDAQAAKFFRKAPFAEIDAVIPKIVAHNLARAEVREAVVAEVRAVIEELSSQTIGEVLDEAGLRELSRKALLERGLPLARELVASDRFSKWWTAQK
jgi:hypothetical protein